MEELLQRGYGTAPVLLVLHGPAGVGKTAFAVHVLHRWGERFPDGQLYVDLSRPQPASPADVLGQFLRACGLPGGVLPDSMAERQGLWRSLTADRQIAVLLESPINVEQVRSLLPNSPRSLTVITTREPLVDLVVQGAHAVALESLDQRGSRELLERYLGADAIAGDLAAVTALDRISGGLPIFLAAVAAGVVANPHRTLATTVMALRADRTTLETPPMADDLPAVFTANYLDLPDDMQRAYRVLGVYPGRSIGPHLLAAGAEVTITDAVDQLAQLAHAGLLSDDGHGHYHFHDLHRRHAIRLGEWHDAGKTRAAALQRMVRWALHCTRLAARIVLPARRELRLITAPAESTVVAPEQIRDHASALAWLDRLRRDLGALVEAAAGQDWSELAVWLADAMQPLAILHKDYDHTTAIDEIALEQALRLDDHRLVAGIRERLSRFYARSGQFPDAETHATALMALADRGGPAILGKALKARGILLAAQAHLDEAATDFRESAAIYRELDNVRGEGLVRHNLADVLIDLHQPAEAIDALTRSRVLLTSLDHPDLYNVARVDISMAKALIHRGDAARAGIFVEDALVTMTGFNAPAEQARAHDVLAELAHHEGDDEEATRHQMAAAALRAPVGTPLSTWMGQVREGATGPLRSTADQEADPATETADDHA